MHISVKYYSIFFSFGLHLIYSVSEHKKSDVTVHSVHSNVAKIHSRLPLTVHALLSCEAVIQLWASNEADCEYPLDFPFAVSYGYMTI